MSIIMDNALRGAERQSDLCLDAMQDDFELAMQHYLAEAYLRGITAEYYPIEGEL